MRATRKAHCHVCHPMMVVMRAMTRQRTCLARRKTICRVDPVVSHVWELVNWTVHCCCSYYHQHHRKYPRRRHAYPVSQWHHRYHHIRYLRPWSPSPSVLVVSVVDKDEDEKSMEDREDDCSNLNQTLHTLQHTTQHKRIVTWLRSC